MSAAPRDAGPRPAARAAGPRDGVRETPDRTATHARGRARGRCLGARRRAQYPTRSLTVMEHPSGRPDRERTAARPVRRSALRGAGSLAREPFHRDATADRHGDGGGDPEAAQRMSEVPARASAPTRSGVVSRADLRHRNFRGIYVRVLRGRGRAGWGRRRRGRAGRELCRELLRSSGASRSGRTGWPSSRSRYGPAGDWGPALRPVGRVSISAPPGPERPSGVCDRGLVGERGSFQAPSGRGTARPYGESWTLPARSLTAGRDPRRFFHRDRLRNAGDRVAGAGTWTGLGRGRAGQSRP